MVYMNPGASGEGYMSAMKVSVDKVNVKGLILVPRASSRTSAARRTMPKSVRSTWEWPPRSAASTAHCGATIWPRAQQIANGTLTPMFTYPGPLYQPTERLPKQGLVPVYPVAPLLDAAVRLFACSGVWTARSSPNATCAASLPCPVPT